MLETLRKQVYEANMELPRRGLVTFTWGNVSGIDRAQGLVVIKPSGVEYEALTPRDMVVLDLESGRVLALVVPGRLRFFGLLGREPDRIFPWESVKRFGADIILVDGAGAPRLRRGTAE